MINSIISEMVGWLQVTRYTVRGRGAKHFFPSGSAPGGSLPEAVFLSHTDIRSRTSVQRLLIWCPNSHLVRSIMSMLRFQKKTRVPKLRKEDFQRRLGVLEIDDNHKLQSVTQRVEQCLSVAEPFHPKCYNCIFYNQYSATKIYPPLRKHISPSTCPEIFEMFIYIIF